MAGKSNQAGRQTPTRKPRFLRPVRDKVEAGKLPVPKTPLVQNTKSINLFPEHLDRTSRKSLVMIWRVLDHLGNNKLEALQEAAKVLGIQDKDLRDAVRELGRETELYR